MSQTITSCTGKIVENGRTAEFEGGSETRWSIHQCRNKSGNGAIYPMRFVFKAPVLPLTVAIHCLNQLPRKFKHFRIYPSPKPKGTA